MRHREQIINVLTQLGRHLGLEVQINAPPPRQKLCEAIYSAAEVEWILPLFGRVKVEIVRQFVPDFPENLPVAGFILSEEKDRAPQQFYHLAMLAGKGYPLGFLVTDGATSYRQAHRSLRTFHHLFGPAQTLVLDVQQLEATIREIIAGDDVSLAEIREPHFVSTMAETSSPPPFTLSAPKTWTAQIKTLLTERGKQAGLLVSENAAPVDFAADFENLREHFKTVQGYLQPVLLEEIGHALGFYHSQTPLDNRPPEIVSSYTKKIADIKSDIIWRIDLPEGIGQLLAQFFELDKSLRYAAPLLQSRFDGVPLIGFNVERAIVPNTAGRMLMLGRGCRYGIVITPQSQVAAAQNLLKLLGGTAGLGNVSIISRQQILQPPQ